MDKSLHAWRKIIDIVSDSHATGVFPGAVVGVRTEQGETYVTSIGTLRGDASQPVRPTTIYDAASITKAIPTSMCALQAACDGRSSLSDLLTDWLPEYHGDWAEKMTIEDLLAFRVPFAGSLSAHKNESAQKILDSILDAQINEKYLGQGKTWYVNTNSILLGLALEKVECQKLDQTAALRCFQPGQMVDSSLSYSRDLLRTAPAEIDGWRGGEVCSETHDESAWKLHGGKDPDQPGTINPGSAGLFTTVPDLLEYFDQPAVWELLEWSREHTGHILGWEQYQPWLGSPGARDTVFGKTGFTGCCVYGDVATRRIGVLLSNATYPTRPSDPAPMRQLRQRLVEAWL